jgi:hypothetical protein
MMLTIQRITRFLVAIVSLSSAAQTDAAMMSLNLLGNGAEKLLDPQYSDRDSMLLRTTSNGQTFSLSAAYYGDDELSTSRWGLLDASKQWNRGKEGAMLQQGFAPSAIGSTKHLFTSGKGTPTLSTYASYVSLLIDKSSATLFSSVRVDLIASTLSLASTAWAGTSADNFASAVTTTRGSISSQGRAYSWDFSSLNYSGDAPLELRFYGLQGADSALINNLQIHLNAVAIPEPRAMLGLGLISAVWLLQRKRKSLAL